MILNGVCIRGIRIDRMNSSLSFHAYESENRKNIRIRSREVVFESENKELGG